MPVTILGENALTLPAGNTAARPGSPSTGETRYNTSTTTIEYFNGTAWVGVGLQDGSSSSTAAPSASYIKTITGTTTTGLYWIKNSSMNVAVEVYCDMSYDGGGWMMLAYGYTDASDRGSANYAIPNLNHDGTVYAYNPTSRASNHGMVSTPALQKSALLIAKASTFFLMAAGNNPSSGGIDAHSYVYRFPIPNPSSLTFNNHTFWYNGNMGTSTVTVTGLKGDSGTWTRYTITESLGASWGDSYPTGYGAISSTSPKSTNINDGPFFPCVFGGSRGDSGGGGWVASPDLGVNGFSSGTRQESYQGWYRPGGRGNSGGMTIWVK
jgi:hypothetical protein